MTCTKKSGRAALCTLAATVMVVLAGCAGQGDSAPDPATDGSAVDVPTSGPATLVPSEVRDDGPLQVVTTIYPPFGSFGDDGQTLEGIDVATAEALEPLLGMEIEVVNATFDNFIPGLQADRFDAGFNAITDTEERREVVDFININKYGGQVLTLPETEVVITDLLSLCGLSVGTEKGSIGVEIMQEVSSSCTAEGAEPVSSQTYGTQDEALVALVSGRLDTVFTGSSGGWLAQQSDGKYIANGPLLPDQDGGFSTGGLALPKDSPVHDAILAAMQQLYEDGTLSEIYGEYGLEDMLIEPEASS